MKRWPMYLVLAMIVFLELIFATQVIRKQSQTHIDVALINDLSHQLDKEQVNYANVQALSTYSFCVIDQENNLIFAGDDLCATSIQEAWAKRDVVLELEDTFVFIHTNDEKQQSYQEKQMLWFYAFIIIQTLGCIFIIEWIQLRFFKPFKNLQKFAQHITEGNLDYPLRMDRNQSFGAFSESFDMMRDALKHANEQEAMANKSKKELVAKLSHDIKTPVATIKAVSELMQIKVSLAKEKEQLSIISAKADQIDTLISNLFHATLEELEQLQVQSTIQSTSTIQSLFEQADYDHRIHIETWENALISYDSLRLSQVIDNIISNAYKYANSEIDIVGICRDDMYIITIQDHGGGIDEQELPYIQDKFYRGKNTGKQSGSGLGLYISTYFIHAMKGEIIIENRKDGLCITLSLRLDN